MTEPIICKCGGLVVKVTTPLKTETPGPNDSVLQTTYATLKSFKCRKCCRSSRPNKDLMIAIINWGSMK